MAKAVKLWHCHKSVLNIMITLVEHIKNISITNVVSL